MDSNHSSDEPILVEEVSSLSIQNGTTEKELPTEVPPHRSHDPNNNLKRTDPFKFGSRILNPEDNVYEFNAWDNVESDDAYKEYAELQFAKQREAPVSDFDKSRFNSNPSKWWNNFYKNNTSNFFKNRKWLLQEFPILSAVTQPSSPPFTLLEVGAGAGNTAFPILALNKNPHLKIHACDFSSKAVDVMRENEEYVKNNGVNIQADVWDVTSDLLPPGIQGGSVDIVLMIFIFSALSPSQWDTAVNNIHKLLKPGGEVLFRDYGRGDLAQVRFKKGRYLEENFYIRGDGTRVYFFEKEELRRIWGGGEKSKGDDATDQAVDTRFEVLDLGVDRRLLVNRAQQLKMYRCWMQGRFRKPDEVR